MASMSSWPIGAGGGGGAGLAGGGSAFAAGFGGGLTESSSAMMRRMEARISSIEGSWAFAGWFITHPRHYRAAHNAACRTWSRIAPDDVLTPRFVKVWHDKG